jgi:hypothetical protein
VLPEGSYVSRDLRDVFWASAPFVGFALEERGFSVGVLPGIDHQIRAAKANLATQ